MRYIIALSILILFVMTEAQAQRKLLCMPQALMVDQLQRKFEETRTAVGVMSPISIAELFMSDAGKWSIIVTSTTGKSCLMLTGTNWIKSPGVKGKKL